MFSSSLHETLGMRSASWSSSSSKISSTDHCAILSFLRWVKICKGLLPIAINVSLEVSLIGLAFTLLPYQMLSGTRALVKGRPGDVQGWEIYPVWLAGRACKVTGTLFGEATQFYLCVFFPFMKWVSVSFVSLQYIWIYIFGVGFDILLTTLNALNSETYKCSSILKTSFMMHLRGIIIHYILFTNLGITYILFTRGEKWKRARPLTAHPTNHYNF